MKQYCRYCSRAIDYNGAGEDFICNANAPCGNNGSGAFYDAAKAKRINHCPHFSFNEIDVFGDMEKGEWKTYKPHIEKPAPPETEQEVMEGFL